MDKKYLEEQMSAYLDGELSPGEISKYEQEIQAYPELFAELQTLQWLNKLAGSSKLTMPDDRYFENLAGRIDSQINTESTGQRSRIVDLIVERRKAIAVLSSVAAVLLVAVISMNLFGPSAKRYPNELPGVESSSPQKSQPASIATDSVVVGKSTAPQSAPPKEARIVNSEQPATIDDQSRSSATSPAADTSSKSPLPSIVIEVPPLVEPQPIEETITLPLYEYQLLPNVEIKKSAPIKPGQLKQRNLSGESSGAAPNSLSALEAPTTTADTVIIFTEPISLGTRESFDAAPAISKGAVARSEIPFRQDSGGLSWDIYRHVFKELDQGVYDGWRLTAPSEKLDSLRAWKDSLNVLGPSRWYAEQAFRSLLTNQITWDEYQRMRAYIDHYTAETQIPDSAVWNRRIPIVNDIYERQIGKQYQEKK